MAKFQHGLCVLHNSVGKNLVLGKLANCKDSKRASLWKVNLYDRVLSNGVRDNDTAVLKF